MLKILGSANLEALFPPLLAQLAEPLGSPLAREWLIVPSLGLQVWLSEQLARHQGICSGISWLLPVPACRELLTLGADAWLSPAELAWQILPGLAELPPEPAFDLIRRFLGEDRRSLDLALRLAGLFESYALYRPAMLSQWHQALPAEASSRWQAWLWRNLPGSQTWPNRIHWPADNPPAGLPGRITVFGCSHLPPLLQQLLTAAAEWIPVSLYLTVLDPAFPGSEQNGSLRQASLHSLCSGCEIMTPTASPAVPASVHACAGPLRELEALRGWLLTRLAEDPALAYDQIAIRVPDLRPYQALIPFVFDRAPALPVKIHGLRPLERSALLQAFQKVLELADSRLERQAVLALLELEPVAQRFDLDLSERELCRHWLDQVNIRWGWDASQRSELTRVAFAENSWQAGLDRLLLGYVMGHEQGLFAGIAPYADLEGSQGQTLGKLLTLLEALRQTRSQLCRKHTLTTWSQLLGNLLERFLAPLEDSTTGILTELFARLGGAERWFPTRVALSRVRQWLQFELHQLIPEVLPGGQIACATLEFMQQVPTRILCVLGLNDGVFPHLDLPGELNLLQLAPEAGDPLPRDLDRETWHANLQSARQAIWISYQGIRSRDGMELPPSLLVTEFLETWPVWEAGFEASPDSGRKAQIHALHPPLPEPDPDQAENGSLPLSDFSAEALPLATQPGLPLPLEQWLAFWHNPAGFFLRARLELGFARASEAEDDSEALDLPALERYHLGQRLINREGSLEAAYAEMRARSELPVGRLGRIKFEEGANQAEAFAVRKRAFEGEAEAHDLTLVWPPELAQAGLQLEGQLSLWPDGLRFSRYGALRPQELLDGWISHLLLQLQDLPLSQKTTRLLGIDKQVRFDPILAPEPFLEPLLQLTRSGLTQALAWFPQSSFAYAEALHKGKTPEAALFAAEAVWLGRAGQPGESQRPEWRVCFRETPVLGPRFQELAETVYLPMLAAMVNE